MTKYDPPQGTTPPVAPPPLDTGQEALVKAFAQAITDAMQNAKVATSASKSEEAAKAAEQYGQIKSALLTFFEKSENPVVVGRYSNV